jgi:hypothetical protein
MKLNHIVRLLCGATCFIFIVLPLLRANLLASLVQHHKSELDPKAQAIILNEAASIDLCETDILNALGDAYFLAQNPLMATMTYGRAMVCSPGNSSFRFKYGEALFLVGFNGLEHVDEALILEKNNPLYNQEVQRLKMLTVSNPQYKKDY